MLWQHETINGAFLCDRYTVTVPLLGTIRVERWDHRKLNEHKVWRLSTETGFQHDLVADTPDEAKQEAIDLLRGRLVEIIEILL